MRCSCSLFRAASCAIVLGAATSALSAQKAPAKAATPERTRAIRREIPLTNMIKRAFAAGTRDSTGKPGAKYWQLYTDYTINAKFDAPTSTVSGRETIVLRNTSPAPMTSVQLRLDQNIFAANVPRAETVTEITDGMKVTRMTIDGAAVDLNPPAAGGRGGRGGAAAAPTSARATGITQTTARVALANPIAPGASATMQVEWNFRVPRADNERGLRMGRWADTLYQVAQWYPRVAVFDDLRQGGWDTDPYLGPSEFYNNFGHFDVTIDAPAGWIIGSTGVLQNPDAVLSATTRERLSHALESDSQRTVISAAESAAGKGLAAGERLQWHFVADSVADVAWGASNKFVWDVTRATIPGKGAIPVNILYLPGHAEGAGGRPAYSGAGQIARHALEFYSKLWMPYAFPQLTVVDGPEGGMEYPMFIMSSAGASDHETGHQWWPMMVGVNETWYGFMDEGFNQYMNGLSRSDTQKQPANLDGLGQSYGRTSGDEREAPLMWDANFGGPNYQFQAYGKAPLMLSMLGGIVGDTAVWKAMSDYAKTWRFKHPSPWDYAFYMSNALKQDLGWFWYYWLFTTESVDGGIQKVTTAGARTTVTVQQDGEMPSPVVLKVQFAPKGPAIKPMKNATMADSATAIVTYPVSVWFNGSRTFNATLDFGARKIEKITLDPGCRFPDHDLTDNVWPRAAAAATTTAAPAGPGGGGAGRGGARCGDR